STIFPLKICLCRKRQCQGNRCGKRKPGENPQKLPRSKNHPNMPETSASSPPSGLDELLHLALYLTGKAQKAYSSLNARDAQNYDCVKVAIFHQYELNVETFRQRFRAYRYSNSDGPCEAYAQLHELLLKWIQPERKTGEQILEMIALEQFIEILPDKVKLWVQEHRPEVQRQFL
uniref:SCAN box domain-containing protein n=1 Tax=Xenopus tropicalis TaxID=8364 RepID=A0A803JP00_XENTR